MTKFGFTVIEATMSIALLGIYTFAMQTGNAGAAKNQIALTNRWKAQVVAESVSDLLTSLSTSDLYALLATGTSGNTYFNASSSAQTAWLNFWQSDPAIRAVRFKVSLDNGMPSSLPSFPAVSPPCILLPYQTGSLPTSATLPAYDMQFDIQVDYLRTQQSSIETLNWSKLVARN